MTRLWRDMREEDPHNMKVIPCSGIGRFTVINVSSLLLLYKPGGGEMNSSLDSRATMGDGSDPDAPSLRGLYGRAPGGQIQRQLGPSAWLLGCLTLPCNVPLTHGCWWKCQCGPLKKRWRNHHCTCLLGSQSLISWSQVSPFPFLEVVMLTSDFKIYSKIRQMTSARTVHNSLVLKLIMMVRALEIPVMFFF